MASNTNRKRSKQHESSLDKAMKRFKDSQDYQKSNWRDKWDRDNKLYNSQRVNAQYRGVTDTFVPMTFSTVETMVAALNNANLRFDYKSGDPLRQASTAPLNALIDEWWDDDQWDLAFEEGEREMLITGMAPFMLSWEVDHPHLEYGAMADFIVDPTARNPYDLQKPGSYAGRRYYVRKGSLDEYEVVDLDESSTTYGQMVKRFKMPRNAGSSVGTTRDDDKADKEMFSTSTLSTASDDQDEVIELWDVDCVTTVLNRKDVVEERENPYKARHRVMLRRQYIASGLSEEEAQKRADSEAEGLVPFFFFRNYRRSSLLYAKSEIDAIAKLQENLNDSRNMQSDAGIKALARQKELDPKYADFIDLIDEEPETVYPFVPGSLRPIDPVRLDGNSFNYEAVTKDEMRETTAIDQMAKGLSAGGNTTATEVNKRSASTSERIESKARILEKDGLFWMAKILFRMFQLFVDEPLVVEVKGADLDELKTTVTLPNGEVRKLPEGSALLDPADYQGEWRPKVTLEIDAISKRADEQEQSRQSFQIMVQDPTNNLTEAKKVMYPKMFDLTKDELDKIITPDPAQQMGGLPTDPMAAEGAALPTDAAGAPAEQPLPTEAVAPVDEAALQQFLTPEEWAQLQAALGAPQAEVAA